MPPARAPGRPPIVRGQAPERPPALLKLPAPEHLGIQLGKKEVPLDWDWLRREVDRLGAHGFQLEKHGAGFRFSCQLPGSAVEGFGDTEAAAVRNGLARIR